MTAHPLHSLRKLRLFRVLSCSFDPMLPQRLPALAHPIYLRLRSHGSQIFHAPEPEAAIRQTFETVLQALLGERRQAFWDVGANIVPCAVAERSGRATFFVDDIAGASGSLEKSQSFNFHHYGHRAPEMEVETVSLDDFLARGTTPPSFIKNDVEGAELRILQGGAGRLRDHRPILL
jgi:FkbM family methyltransferase